MGLLWACIVGIIVGALAKFIFPGKDPGGIFVTMIIGIVGSVLAGFIGRALGWYQPGEGAGLIASVVGALLVLWLYKRFASRPVT
jgi:uncharacterized membrane protein YeaQ/YmgE (transglycosylase-associated protein family)